MSNETPGREAILLVNSRSLKGKEWFEQAQSKLADRGLRVAFCEAYSKVPPLLERVKQEIGPGKLIIVGGGDGTLSAVANILIKSEAVMGVLPLGTGNAFARDLGIPTDLDKAIDVLASGGVEEVDMGVCGDRYFLNVATIGLTVLVAKNLTVPMKRRFGRFVYAIALVQALKKIEPFKATIETENGTTEIDTVQIVLGNGRYHGGPLPLSPTAAITSGHLRLYAVEFSTKAALLRYAMLLPTGLQGLLKEVHSERTTGGKIATFPYQSIVVDGEIGLNTPVTFAIAPGALNVIAPKDFKG